jgi:hypothetical protein
LSVVELEHDIFYPLVMYEQRQLEQQVLRMVIISNGEEINDLLTQMQANNQQR